MKSVTLSQVVRAHDPYRFLFPIQSWSQLISLCVVLAIGLPLIVMALRLLDPSAPLAYIVLPALAGATAPLFAALPGRFEVLTRFHARQFLNPLEQALITMGYSRGEAGPECTRYCSNGAAWMRWRENEIRVTVNEHVLGIKGPIFMLRVLQQKLTEPAR